MQVAALVEKMEQPTAPGEVVRIVENDDKASKGAEGAVRCWGN